MGVRIRRVTAESLAEDLATGHVDVHPDIAADLPEGIGGGAIDFLVAESPAGEPRGQVGINWIGATSEQTRDALGLSEGETAPNIAFMETVEGHRRQGIARALLRAATAEIQRRGHRRAFLTVATGNAAARALYESEGFAYTGLTKDSPQRDRNPDRSYGAPTTSTMDFLAIDLPPAAPGTPPPAQ